MTRRVVWYDDGDDTYDDGTGDLPIASSSGSSVLLYDYEVTGSDKASIDTFVDGTTVANFSGYRIVEAYLYGRTDEAVVLSTVLMTLNNDTGGNYDVQRVTGANVTASAATAAASTALGVSVSGANAGANVFGLATLIFPNLNGTVGYKPIQIYHGTNDTTAANSSVNLRGAQYRSTAAITRMKFAPSTGGALLKIGSRLIVLGK